MTGIGPVSERQVCWPVGSETMGEGLGDGTLEKWAFGRIGVLASSLDGLAAVGLEVGQHGGSRGHTLPMEGGGGIRWGVLLGMPPSPGVKRGGPCHGGPDRMILDTRQFARYFATGLEGARFPGPGAGGRYF